MADEELITLNPEDYYDEQVFNHNFNYLENELKNKARLVNGKVPLSQLTIDTELSLDSVAPVGNKFIKRVIDNKADLNENGKIPEEQLPSYVDDVVEYDSVSDFPEEGEKGKIYVDTEKNETYRWSGTMYVKIGGTKEEYKAVAVASDANVVTIPDEAKDYAAVSMICGKTVKMVNLINAKEFEYSSTTRDWECTVDDNDTITIKGNDVWTANGAYSTRAYIPVTYGKTYTFILNHISGYMSTVNEPNTKVVVGFEYSEFDSTKTVISGSSSFSKASFLADNGVKIVTLTPANAEAQYISLRFWSNGTTGGGKLVNELKVNIRVYDSEDNTIEEFVPYGNHLWNATVEKIVAQNKNYTPVENRLEGKGYSSSGVLANNATSLAYSTVDVIKGEVYTIFGIKPNSALRVVQWNDSTLAESAVYTADSTGKYTFTAIGNKFAMNALYTNIVSDVFTVKGTEIHKKEISLSDLADLPDYGCSAGDVFNCADFKEMKYHHRCKINADSSDTEVLSTEEIIDIKPLVTILPIEAGGTIEFVNEHNLSVPNTVLYKEVL